MLKRLSCLVLGLVVGGSALAGTARLHDEHVCKMAGMEMMPGMETMAGMETMRGMETMPCYKGGQAEASADESSTVGLCCVTIPQEPGSTGITFNLRSPSFSVAVIHPAIVQSPMTLPKPSERPYSTQLFLPNLQSSYIRNLSLLI